MASFKSGLARTFSASQNEKQVESMLLAESDHYNIVRLQPLIFSNPRKSADLMKLSLWKKIGFAVGSMPFSMCSTIMGFYLTVFLLEVALVSFLTALMSMTSIIRCDALNVLSHKIWECQCDKKTFG